MARARSLSAHEAARRQLRSSRGRGKPTDRFVDDIKDAIDNWIDLSPDEARTALKEVIDYAHNALDSVDG